MNRRYLFSAIAPALLGWAALIGTGVRADPPAAGPVVKSIKFTANTPDGQPSLRPSVLLWAMETKAGQPYSTTVLARDLDRLFNHATGLMHADGLIADVSGAGVRFVPETGVLLIPIVETHVAHIIITGSHKVSTPEILKQVHAQPGDLYSDDVTEQDSERVYETGLFHTVGPVEVRPVGVGLADVIIPVTEK